ncbi:hypothetical protein ACF0H5_020453 [Mactra antiquata]
MQMLSIYICLLCTVTQCRADAVEDFQNLIDDYWTWRLQDAPEFAGSIDVMKYKNKIESYSVNALEERHDKLTEFLNKLKAIDRTMLNQTSQVAYDVLVDTLTTYTDGYQWKNYGPMNPVNFLEGIWTDPESYIPRKLETFEDFNDFIKVIILLGAQVDDFIARMNISIAKETTNHNVTMVRVMPQLDRLIANSSIDVALYKPFTDVLGNSSLSQSDINTLRSNATTVVTTFRNQYIKLKTFLTDVYMPNTRTGYGVSSFTNGQEYYKACLKWHLGIDISPEDVHQKGKDEVQRISLEMFKVMERLGFNGTVKEFFDSLKNDSKFFIESPEETVAMFTSIIKDRIQPKLGKYFKDIPDSKVIVKEMPYDGPGGSYSFGSPNGERPGIFYVNVMRSENNPTYDMVALALHETDPGHHLQDVYAQAAKGIPIYLKVQDYTKYFSVPAHFPFYTSFTEGWALYAESLGENDQLDIYKDDYELMGRYSSEMFRACRLVVDTGLHYFNWTRDEAIEYILNYTSFNRESMAIEVDRYITWPGQATAYKIGELKIKDLRLRAKKELGTKFDIRKFHSVILNSGAVPLQIMERRILAWIEQEKDSFEKLMSDFWSWRMESSPEFSTTLNMYKYNDRLNSYSYMKLDDDRIKVQGFRHRLSYVQRDTLTTDKKVSYDILQNILDVFLTGYKWKDYQPLNPINFLEGWFTGFDQFVSSFSFDTQGDFVNYVRRIELAPKQLDEMMNLSRLAIQKGHVNNNASVSRIPEQIDSMVNGTEIDSELYEPFNNAVDGIFESGTYRESFKTRLTNGIKLLLNKLREVKTFLQEDYMPHTRKGFGLSSTVNGAENYKDCLYFHTSTRMSADEIHQTGREEVARIEKLIRDKMENVGFPRDYSIHEMYKNLTSNDSFLIQDPDESLARFRSLIFDRIEPKIPQYLSNPPNLPLEVRPSGSDGVGGEYWTGTADGSRPGIFYVNLYRPEYNPTYKMVALSLHEALPGHHLAESYGILSDGPDFRKYFEWLSYGVPYFFPFYNAFAEGWALYAEFLGEEMGIYENDYEMLGRYSEEMLRAVRLVVDTGIHSKNWTRERAINYMLNYTAETPDSSAIEIDRYVTWPGQACGYKIGELTIKRLRNKASKELGSLFNLADYHYAVLKNGAMPLDTLEQMIDEWIQSVKDNNKKPAPCVDNTISSTEKISGNFVLLLVPLLLSFFVILP